MRFLPFVLVATGLHFFIPVVARVAPRPNGPLLAISSGMARRMEIDIEDVPIEPMRPDEPRFERPQDPAVAMNDTRPRVTDAVDPRVVEPNTQPNTVEPQQVEPVPTAMPSAAPPDEYGAPPPAVPGGGPGIPGLGGPVWAMPGVIPETGKPKPAPTTVGPPPEVDRKIAGRVISDVMREKDRQLGLDLPGAGTIASVVSDVVRGSGTPDVSRATLEVRIAPGGRVASVRVVRSSAGNAGDWSAVAGAVSGRLASRQFTLPESYAAGAIVMVEVVSQLQMPDGSTGGTNIGKGGSSDSLGGSVSFDVANIGARPKRHVRASASARPAT
ncbi:MULTISPECIES: hypothetical protein [Polyangium]|uniref:TonB family protein n=2 Tax=Polyangium TaxID=55 RepID=A0A4U1JB30_9BACT|nr:MULTISPECIES: hypothetical protein [Polyangium]MDI1428081.1 hypothetical protein [Polyangium sorediatum]TKD06569.1 hypothetical protein E8A74_18845 [Polyangium fumosum]